MQKSEKTKIILALFAICLLLLGTYFFFLRKTSKEVSLPATITETLQKDSEQVAPATETSFDTSRQATLDIAGVKYQHDITEATSVYDFMDKFRAERKINFKDKTYIGLGKFIEEINGVRGDGARFWIYYVNGKKATIGVSNYKINPGDVVSWKYEKDY